MSLTKVNSIISDIREGNIKPIYFLWGDEPYYIDGIANYIEKNVLSEDEKGFNQMVLYGLDVSIDEIVSNAKRYPMMSDRQVVIVKEAQTLSRSIENLVAYAENPQPSTVLVICYKYKKLDARKKLSKAIVKTGIVFESKKLYDNKIPEWINSNLTGQGYSITPKAAQMLADFLGNDLDKINNELEKLKLIMNPGGKITPELIEENIGFSKDFNNFELQKAMGSKDIDKTFRILQYFGQNSKNHPIIVTLALLQSFFTKVLKYHALSDKSQAHKTLGVSPYFINDYAQAAANYPMKKLSSIIASLREIDLKSKGVGAANLPQTDLLKELLVKIFNQ